MLVHSENNADATEIGAQYLQYLSVLQWFCEVKWWNNVEAAECNLTALLFLILIKSHWCFIGCTLG